MSEFDPYQLAAIEDFRARYQAYLATFTEPHPLPRSKRAAQQQAHAYEQRLRESDRQRFKATARCLALGIPASALKEIEMDIETAEKQVSDESSNRATPGR